MISRLIEEVHSADKKKIDADVWEIFPGMTVRWVEIQDEGRQELPEPDAQSRQKNQDGKQDSWKIQICRSGQEIWKAEAPEHFEAIFCMKGKIQVQMRDQAAFEMQQGDLFLMTERACISAFSFLGRTVQFLAADIFTKEPNLKIPVPFEGLLPLKQLREFFTANQNCCILQDVMWGNSLLGALSCLKKEQYSAYFSVRLLERLCLISCKAVPVLNAESEEKESLYYDSYQKERIQDVHAYMQEHYGMHLTIQNLADKFQISPTALKACFRHMYGQPIHSYLQQYRLQMAAHLLATTSESVLSIAMKVGYSGTSRFGVAFKEMYHMTPTRFRAESRRKNV